MYSKLKILCLWSVILCTMACMAGTLESKVVTGTPAPPRSMAATPTSRRPAGQTPLPTPPGGAAPSSLYPIGNPVLTELYVSPSGSDGNSGLAQNAPLQTIGAAWEKIPEGGALSSTGFRINLLPGVYPCEPAEPDNCQNAYHNRRGTAQYPIILRALHGPGTVEVRGGFDISQVAYLYLIDLSLAGGGELPTNQSGNNLLHLVESEHILLRGVRLIGPDCANDTCNNLQEVLKVNQVQYLYVEESEIGGAWHSSVDFFNVQTGHFIHNNVHTAGQWCMYVKGGTSYLRVEGNEFHHCQLGFQAGQSSNLAVMRSPWYQYEAYDIKFVNNLLHDLPGVALSVSGGYNILFAYNTVYRAAGDTASGYTLVQTVLGERGCNATDELPNPLPICRSSLAAGAWGPQILSDNQPGIPNRSVYIYDNLIYNPAGIQSLYAQFYFQGSMARPAGFQNLPDTITSDDNLRIAGNVIWNGPADHPLGIDAGSGCQDLNPTCNAAQLIAENAINKFEPQLANPAGGNYRPAVGSNLYAQAATPIPDFGWRDAPPGVPAGTLSNAVGTDRDGNLRSSSSPVGAYSLSGIPPEP